MLNSNNQGFESYLKTTLRRYSAPSLIVKVCSFSFESASGVDKSITTSGLLATSKTNEFTITF